MSKQRVTGKECIEYRRIAAKEISVLAEAAKPPSQCTCGYKTVFVLTLLRFSFFLKGGNVTMAGGVLCPTCAADTIPHLGCLVSVNKES